MHDYQLKSISSVQISCSVMSDSSWPHGPQHTSPPCPSPTPGVHSNSCPLSRWCHPTISSSVISFSSCLQSFPALVVYSSPSEITLNLWLLFSRSLLPLGDSHCCRRCHQGGLGMCPPGHLGSSRNRALLLHSSGDIWEETRHVHKTTNPWDNRKEISRITSFAFLSLEFPWGSGSQTFTCMEITWRACWTNSMRAHPNIFWFSRSVLGCETLTRARGCRSGDRTGMNPCPEERRCGVHLPSAQAPVGGYVGMDPSSKVERQPIS